MLDLTARRKAKNLTLEDVGRLTGMSRKGVWDFEHYLTSRKQMPRLETINKFKRIYDLTFEELYQEIYLNKYKKEEEK